MVARSKSRWLLILLLVLLSLSLLLPPLFGGRAPFQLGLDLRGGVELRYELPGLEDREREEALEVVEATRGVFLNRLDAHGVKEITVRPVGSQRLEVAIPGISSGEAAVYKELLASLGRLEFRLQASPAGGIDLAEATAEFEAEVRRRLEAGEAITRRSRFDRLTEGLGTEHLTYRWVPVSERFAAEFRGGAEAGPDALPDFVLLEFDAREDQSITGEDIASAYPTVDPTYEAPAVGFEVERDRRRAFADFTDEHEGRTMAIVLDGEIESIASIDSQIYEKGLISRGRTGFEAEERRRLVAVIQSGSLPVEPVLVAESEVGPQLGQAALDRGVLAGALALLLTAAFLLAYYRWAGLVACAVLAVNVLLLLGGLAFLGATLTLPGIAGLVLTVGMAVDATILVFERIREKLALRGALRPAVEEGFQSALSTIVDANVTTFLTAFFLYQFGTGSIRGFAVTLMIGLATSMFATLFFSKSLIAWLLPRGWFAIGGPRLFEDVRVPWMRFGRWAALASGAAVLAGAALFFSQGPEKYGMDFTGGYQVQLQLEEPHTQADVLERVQTLHPDAQVVSVDAGEAGAHHFQVKVRGAADGGELGEGGARAFGDGLRRLFAGELAEPVAGLELGERDASSRRSARFELAYRDAVERAAVEEALAPLVEEGTVEGPEVGRAFAVSGRVALATDSPEEAHAEILRAVGELPAPGGEGSVRLSDPAPGSTYVGPVVGAELQVATSRAILLSLAAIVMYVRIRFRRYRFSLAACAALVHDVLFTLGALALARLTGILPVEFDLAIVAALLTIIGYSLNDTIVIFDRVRENLALGRKPLSAETVDGAINQTLGRTVLTSLTTFLVVAVLFALSLGQGDVLEGFAFALLVGVVAGTFSTVCVASPALLYLTRWIDREPRRPGKRRPRLAPSGASVPVRAPSRAASER